MNHSFNRWASAAALSLLFGGAGMLAPVEAQAYDESSNSAINVEAGNIILHGYDPVAYFTAGQPTRGDARFSIDHAGARYHFASAANKEAFAADPTQYVPQYGGFCAMGAALGKKLDVDPTQFRVVDGKLYLNVNADVFKKWSEDVPGNIAKADSNWPSIKDQTPAAL